MEEHSLRVLEFQKVISMLQDQAACALGREVAGLTYPTTDLAVARRKQQETSEAKSIIDYEADIPFGGIVDIRKHVERALVGAMLQPSDLLSVLSTLQGTRRLNQFLCRLREKYPILADLASEIDRFEGLEAEINQSISQGGEVLDSASSSLARVRGELRTTQARLTEKMNSYLQSSQYRTMIQDPVITLRGDRYCIPIKSDYRGQFPGIVHDASASGATLFVEPSGVVDLGNRRRELVAKEREEVEKVLYKLSSAVGEVGERLQASLNIVGLIDAIAARAKLSIKMGASVPVMNDHGRVDIRGARHPLLQGDIVPIDIHLGKKFNALLITGPNTGGKTVSLKTLGLFTLMAASGLHIPAAPGSEISIFDKVFADIGDEQSIEQSLSTFSSHMTNIVRITRNCTSSSLVLLDEVGAGTDPGEGAALAKAILDYLLSKGAKIVATTHYGELKEFAYMRDGIENASVEFDPETLRPTYRLMIGIPGSSNAFAIATRLGLHPSIVEDAKNNLATHTEATEELIRRIEQSHKEAAEQKRVAEKYSTEAEALRRRYEEQVARLENAKSRVEEKAREKAEAMLNAYSKKLENTLQELAAQKKDSKRAQDLKKNVEKLIDRLDEETTKTTRPQQVEETLPTEGELKPGAKVRIASVNQDGEIMEHPHDGKVVVMVGSMRVTVPISALRRPTGQPEWKKKEESTAAKISMAKAQSFNPEIHLRGQRVEAALFELDKYLDDALAAGVESVRIVHGKGTGVLRQAIWEYLKAHKGVKSYKLAEHNEGGSGVTVATMKY